MSLDGKVAIVTGAGRGIGRGIAHVLAGYGAKVALVARSAQQLEAVRQEIEQRGGSAVAIPADVSDLAAVRSMTDRVLKQWGRIDLLVNNAGIFNSPGPLWESTPARWWEDVRVNLLGTYTCSHVVLPYLLEQGDGAVFNMVGGGAPAPFLYASSYGSSKAAIARLSDVMAAELTGTGVRAYTIGPGLVRSEMTEHLIATPEGEKQFAGIAQGFAEGKDRTPEESGELVACLYNEGDERHMGRFFLVGVNTDAISNGDELVEKDQWVLRIDMTPPPGYVPEPRAIPTAGSGRCVGKRVVVTGAGRGIGRCIALALAREGASVLVAARTQSEVDSVVKEIHAAGGRALGMSVDVAREDRVKTLIDRAIAEFGGIDLLFNNAGIYGPAGTIWDVTPEDWWEANEINLLGTYLGCRYAVPQMLKQGSGMILNMLGGGAVAPKPGSSAYGASKTGVARLSDTLAGELKDTGVRVLTFGPGLVKTRMTEVLLQGGQADRFFDGMRRTFDEGGNREPEESGELAVRLLMKPDKRLDGRLIAVGFNESVVDEPSLVEGTNRYLLRLKVK